MTGHRTLCLVGCNLALINLCLVRELASLQYCTEVLLLFLTVSFFAGQAMGFANQRHLGEGSRFLCFCWLTIPMPMLLLLRIGCGYVRADYPDEVFYLIAFLYLTSLSAVYSAFLPQAVDGGGPDRSSSLAKAYSFELLGSLGGFACLLLLGSRQELAMVLLYPILLLTLAREVGFRRGQLRTLVALAIISAGIYFAGDKASTERYYKVAFGYDGETRLIHRENSPYQKIEILQVGTQKILFLNGVEFFSRGQLDNFNFYLSEVPARLSSPQKVLIIGSGSMSAVGRLAPYAGSVTTVELDAAVVRASRQHFVKEHPPEGYDHQVVIDDARRFLRNTEERFDLIILDIPTAFTLQTGTLFTSDFFRLAKTRLSEQGILSIYLTQPIDRRHDQSVAGPILAAVAGEFEEFTLLTALDVSNSFVLASDSLPFDRNALDQLLAKEGRYQQNLFEDDLARAEAAKWEPASLRNLRHVWEHQ